MSLKEAKDIAGRQYCTGKIDNHIAKIAKELGCSFSVAREFKKDEYARQALENREAYSN